MHFPLDRGRPMLPEPSSAVPFSVSRIDGARTLWLDEPALNARGDGPWSFERFGREFGFAVDGTPCFATVEFDRARSKQLHAERYGGFGTGRHGGGARVGNWSGFQLKGVGKNPLAGPSDGSINGEFHSFGGFPIADALCELINAEVLSHVLPVGAVKCFGLILAGERTAFYPQRVDAEPSLGAILVREQCLRPAHFLRNGAFEVTPQLLMESGNDVARVRTMCRSFRDAVGGDRAFVKYVGSFLARCANQLTLARLFRVNHGSLSPSNLSTDGRWLDMMGSSFLPPGADYAPAPWVPSFSSEMDVIKPIVWEWAHSYSKHCQFDIKVAPLLAYYDQQCSAYSDLHVPAVLGCPVEQVADTLNTKAGRKLANALLGTLIDGLRLTDALPVDHDARADTCYDLVRSLYLGEDDGARSVEVRQGFEELLREVHGQQRYSSSSWRLFKRSAMLAAAKRLLYASFFYRGRLIGQASAIAISGDADFAGMMIDEWRDVARWVFEPHDQDEHTIVSYGGFGMKIRSDGTIFCTTGRDACTFSGSGRFDQALDAVRTAADRLHAPARYGYPPIAAYDFGVGAAETLKALARADTLD